MATHVEAGAAAGGPGYRATALKPAITRTMLLFFIVGDILGGGIYALVGEVGDKVGGAIWTAFALAGVVAAFTAASYAELVSKYPLAGGAALFVHRAFRVPLFTFLIAFAVVCSGLASAATLATAFGGDYLSEFVDLPEVLVGLGIAGSVYLLVTVIASMAVPTDTLAGSDGPLLDVVQVGPLAMNTKVFSAIALFALVNGALINMVMASRLLYGMAQQGVIPRWFGRVHAGRRTPWAGILLSGSLAAVLVVTGDLETLADTTVLLLLFAFVAVHASVLVLRRTPVDHEHFTAWTGFPVLGGLCCAALIIQKLVEDTVVFAYAGGLLAFGLALWLLERALAGPTDEIDPASLVD
jgi:amino acid transporter